MIAALLWRRGNRRGVGVATGAALACAALAVTAGWTVVGTALALTVGAQFVPQVAMAWRSDDLTALAGGTYLVCAVDGVVWGGFGVLSADGPLVLYGAVMLSVAVLVLVPKRRWARNATLAAAAPGTTHPAA